MSMRCVQATHLSQRALHRAQEVGLLQAVVAAVVDVVQLEAQTLHLLKVKVQSENLGVGGVHAAANHLGPIHLRETQRTKRHGGYLTSCFHFAESGKERRRHILPALIGWQVTVNPVSLRRRQKNSCCWEAARRQTVQQWDAASRPQCCQTDGVQAGAPPQTLSLDCWSLCERAEIQRGVWEETWRPPTDPLDAFLSIYQFSASFCLRLRTFVRREETNRRRNLAAGGRKCSAVWTWWTADALTGLYENFVLNLWHSETRLFGGFIIACIRRRPLWVDGDDSFCKHSHIFTVMLTGVVLSAPPYRTDLQIRAESRSWTWKQVQLSSDLTCVGSLQRSGSAGFCKRFIMIESN